MPRNGNRITRHDSTFTMLCICTALVLCIFCLAASKVAREVAAEVHIFWAIVYTLSLCILTLLYATLLISFYPSLGSSVAILITNFTLGVAWAVALVAEIVDPNNIIAAKRKKGGEALVLFRVRVALSGCVSIGLLGMTLVLGVRAMRLGGEGVAVEEWEMRRASVGTVLGRDRGDRVSGGGGRVRGVLVRVGLLKERPPAAGSATATTTATENTIVA